MFCSVLFGILVVLIPAMVYGIVVGTSTIPEATALNNARHVVFTPNKDTIHLVYQTIEGGNYEGYLVTHTYMAYPPTSEPIGPNNDETGYPTITYLPAILNPWGSCSAILVAYLNPTGEIVIPDSPYPKIVVGTRIGLWAKVFPPNGPPKYAYAYIPAEANQSVGIPTCIAHISWSTPDATTYVFLLTYISYEPCPCGYNTEVILIKGEIIVNENGVAIISGIEELHRVGGGSWAHNPSTAVAQFTAEPPGVWTTHTVWEDDLYGSGIIRYQVGLKVVGGDWQWPPVEDLKNGLSYNPFIYAFGDRLLLTWTHREFDQFWQPGETYRNFKQSQYFNQPLRGWLPSDENMTTYLDHYSENYDSDYPQGDACTITCQEEVPGDSNIYYAWKDTCDYSPSWWRYWDYVSYSSLVEIYPSLKSRTGIVHDGDNWVLDEWNHFVGTTRSASGSVYTVWSTARGRTLWGMGVSSLCLTLKPGPQNQIRIEPDVSIFYEVVCGNPKPSIYCLKRDAYLKTDRHKVDRGNNDLIYDLPFLDPNFYYLVQAVVWAPEATTETFSFDGTEISLSSNSVKSETLQFIISPDKYKDRDVKLRITGPGSVYLENLKVYQFEIIESDPPLKPQALQFSSQDQSESDLSVLPSLFKNSSLIRYSLSKTERIKLNIYDISGRVVENLVDSERTAGIHTVKWNHKNHPSGTYFVQLATSNRVLTKKIIVLK